MCDLDKFSQGWKELPAHGIYCLDIKSSQQNNLKNATLNPWIQDNGYNHPSVIELNEHYMLLSNNVTLSESESVLNDFPCTFGEFGIVPLFGQFNRTLPKQEEQTYLTQEISIDDVELATLATDTYHKLADCLLDHLKLSVAKRVNNQPSAEYMREHWLQHQLSQDSPDVTPIVSSARLAVLYSGGIDSHLLAAIADKYD